MICASSSAEISPLILPNKPANKNLKLRAMAATPPERIALPRREQLAYASFLEIILSDEVNHGGGRNPRTNGFT